MNRIKALFLILILLLHLFSRWSLLASFALNRDYIAKNLCENRARPQMRCGGKCQLMKKMAREEKGPASQPSKNRFEEANAEAPAGWELQAPALPVRPPLNRHLAVRFPNPDLAPPFHPPAEKKVFS